MARRKFATDEERKEARRASVRAWRKRNPDYTRAARKRYAAAHPEVGRRARKKWTANNRAKMNALQKAWYERNPEKLQAKRLRRKDRDRELQRARIAANPAHYNAKSANRRAMKLQATPPWADHDKIRAVYAEAKRLTIETGVKHVVDHIWPLQGKDGSRGLHVHYNLQVLTFAENTRKANNPPAQP